MARTAFFKRPPIPRISSQVKEVDHVDFSRGLNTYVANDTVPDDQLVHITDARISTLGRYKTRQGIDLHSIPVGETEDANETSTDGADDQDLSTTIWLSQKFTAGTSGRITKVEPNLKDPESAGAHVIVRIYSDSSGDIGSLLAESSIDSNDITDSYGYVGARFVEAPEAIETNDYWIVAFIQPKSNDLYNWSSTDNSSDAMISTNSGVTWTSQPFSLNFKVYISDLGGVKGLDRTAKSDGTRRTLLAHGETLYERDENDKSVSVINNSLNPGATRYRFETVNDTVFYVNGIDSPRKWDFTNDSAVGGSPDVASNLIEHKGIMFYVNADDPTRIFYSNFADYETFTSTDFIHVPAPKTSDPITALAKLNDTLVIFTRRNKYLLYGSDNSTFQLSQSPGQKGTFTQESIAWDGNFVYFASDDGIYRFDGTEDRLISAQITDRVEEMVGSNPRNICLEITKNRLFIFYTPSGEGFNSKCLIRNLAFDSWESEDLSTYIGRTSSLFESENDFVLGSNLVGAIYDGETGDYSNLGKPLTFELRTNYKHFDNPSKFKEIRKWKPRFASQPGNYDVLAQHDLDFRNTPGEIPVPVQGVGPQFDTGLLFNDGHRFGTESMIAPNLSVSGESRYIQLRYRHRAAGQPQEFEGHSLQVQTRGMR